jgi:HPr kinase/phosphorylase
VSDPPPDRAENIHASAVVVGEAGIVIRGRSGRGKSALALALIDIASMHGLFGRLVGDDRVLIRACGGRILLSGAPNTLSLIERRGIGLERVPFEPAAVARLIVDLLDEGESAARMPEASDETAMLAGIRLPRLAFDGSSRPFERARAVLATLWDKATTL